MFRKASRALAVFLVAASAVGLLTSGADARIGGGFSSGSRGSRTFSTPPATTTAPNSTSPMQRAVTQPNYTNPGSQGGMFNRPGGFFNRPGLLGGLFAGFLGAGLLGLLFGHGLFGGLLGFASFIGLIFQLGLIALIAMFVWRFFQRRNPAYATPNYRDNREPYRPAMFAGGGLGSGSGSGPAPSGRSDAVGIKGSDYDAFEKLLGDIQGAYGREDVGAMRERATPEMVAYFAEDLAQNQSRGVQNRISDVKLVNGDLAEAWREGSTDYATTAMRFSLIDYFVDRATGRVVEGDAARPQEVTELWTFRRAAGGPWLLSAIQQKQ